MGDSVAANKTPKWFVDSQVPASGMPEQFQNIIKGECELPEVCALIDTNNIARKRDEVPQSQYRELSSRLKTWTSRAITYGFAWCHVPKGRWDSECMAEELVHWREIHVLGLSGSPLGQR